MHSIGSSATLDVLTKAPRRYYGTRQGARLRIFPNSTAASVHRSTRAGGRAGRRLFFLKSRARSGLDAYVSVVGVQNQHADRL